MKIFCLLFRNIRKWWIFTFKIPRNFVSILLPFQSYWLFSMYQCRLKMIFLHKHIWNVYKFTLVSPNNQWVGDHINFYFAGQLWNLIENPLNFHIKYRFISTTISFMANIFFTGGFIIISLKAINNSGITHYAVSLQEWWTYRHLE